MTQPWLNDPIFQPQPAAQNPYHIAPDPILAQRAAAEEARRQEDQRSQQRGDVRADIGTGIQQRGEDRQQGNDQFNQIDTLRQRYDKMPAIVEYRTTLPQLMAGLKAPDDGTGDSSLVYAWAKVMDPMGSVREGDVEMAGSGSSTLSAQAAKLRREFNLDGGGVLPPEVRSGLKRDMNTKAVETSRSYLLQRKRFEDEATAMGFDPERVVGPHDSLPFRDDYYETTGQIWGEGAPVRPGMERERGDIPGIREPTQKEVFSGGVQWGSDTPEMQDSAASYLEKNYGLKPGGEAEINAFWNANRGNPDLTIDGVREWYSRRGMRVNDADISAALTNAQKPGVNFTGSGAEAAEQSYYNQLDQVLQQRGADPESLSGAAGIGAAQGFTLSGIDEAGGIGGAVNATFQGQNPIAGYQAERDLIRREHDRAGQAHPYVAGGAELLGSLPTAGLGFARAGRLGGLTRQATTIGDTARASQLGRAAIGATVRPGATAGGIYGFNAGEGPSGSLTGAATGAAIGAAVSPAMQWAAPHIGNAAQMVTSRFGRQPNLAPRARDLANAGQAERVTVNRAMVDPSLANRVSGVDATLTGGPRLQRGMTDIEGQIEGRVNQLGGRGRAMNEVTGGQMVERAGRRAIEKTGKSAQLKYNRAERLAGNARVEPRESLSRVESMIADLSETASTNADEIAYLQTVREDLTKNLSVGALRRMRTKLRKKISKGDLVFGEDEARVLAIMDGAADDIRAGLTQLGKAAAARAFDTADKAYRARMEYIGGTVQTLLGKRQANVPAEKMWTRFQAMASNRGDAVGLRKFYASLAPDERSDVAATFASELGRNNAGEFSVAHFLSQSENLSEDALRTVFGPQGAESIRNLRMLGTEVKRVTSAMNSRTSKSGVALGWRSRLTDLLLGGGLGGAAGLASGGTGTTLGAVAGAAVVGGANAGRNYLSARALMSPDLTRWLRQTPQSSNPQAMQAHMRRLGAIARAEPMLAGDIDILTRAINDNLPVAAQSAAEEGDRNQRNGYAR